ncbi:hypothetical protein CEP53_006596 [Fusarium sp. AF-6]|nr:hypothetical protein CEP53_006596 [Fusarium sp. AF-6]
MESTPPTDTSSRLPRRVFLTTSSFPSLYNMDFFTEKQLINSRSLQYTYYAGPASNVTSTADDPALLLLHGFPHTAQLWAPIIPWLLTLGLRILVPDLLGYGGTSKPWDVSCFASNAFTQH